MIALQSSVFASTLPVIALVAGFSGDSSNRSPVAPIMQIVLLAQKSVHGELRLSKEQIEKIKEFLAKVQKDFPDYHKPSDDNRKKLEALADALDKFLEDNLDKNQRKRLKQIYFQLGGLVVVLADPEVDKMLKLTDEQKTRGRDLLQNAIDTFSGSIEAATKMGNHAEAQKAFDLLGSRNTRALDDLLTGEQRKEWQEMMGERFRGKVDVGDLLRAYGREP
jgi:hypothetical protein